MSEEALARLPALARELILADRKLTELRRAPVTDINAFRESRSEVRKLRVEAGKIWGPRPSKNDKAKS